jgi:signal-transduction protein with cAMP-binding, CBS, and nucleotidyltransferase domain
MLPVFSAPKKVGMGDYHVEKRYNKGDYIFLPEEESDRVYFLFEGRVKIGSYSDAGKEITKVILHKGEVLGLLSMVGENRRRDFAQAMEDTTVLCRAGRCDEVHDARTWQTQSVYHAHVGVSHAVNGTKTGIPGVQRQPQSHH